MEFNFDISKTATLRALRLWRFPLFTYAKTLSYVFLYLFVLSLLVLAGAFLGIMEPIVALKISMVLLALYLLFWEISLFADLHIRRPRLNMALATALAKPQDYNLAEFLDMDACAIVESAIKKSKKKKLLGVSSQTLFYFVILQSKDCQIIMRRLGIETQKLLQDLKNYLEKQHRDQQFNLALSEDFKETISDAAAGASARGQSTITPKDLLIALASHDAFFKKILVEYELKEKDVENLTLWLDALEQKIDGRKKFWTRQNLSRFGSLGKDWASGFTVTLNQFSIDWDKIARRDIFNEVIGHQKELEQVQVVLAKSSLSNALIVGEAGVGRKSIVQALAQKCYQGDCLPELKGKRVVELDMTHLVAQIQDPEKLETALEQIFGEALSASNVILVIDQLDNFMEQKVQRPGAVDISSLLAKYLALPNFQFIGITSFDGLHQRIERNPSFLEYFRKVEVTEVSEADTIKILQNLALGMEQKYHVFILYPSLREIVNLTGRYFPSTPFPKKAIDVLDEAAAYVKSQKETVVLPSHVAKIISDKTQIPVGKMEFKEKSVLLNLENLIHQRIIGQEEAVSEIAIAMRRARAGIGSKKRPMGVFLFLGPTGVGKTETAKALAQIYFGGYFDSQSAKAAEDKMIRVDMSEFQAIADIPRLIGAAGANEQEGLLTTPVRENPFSLVLLDEIEKAHPNILNLFLQVFDEGHITDGQGRKIIFTNTIIICTSNAGASFVFQESKAGNKIEKGKLFDFLFSQGIFKPEFINRFDAAVLFHPLTRENLMDIAQLLLAGLQKNLKEKEIDFVISDALKEKIVDLSYKPEFGAREMRRAVQDNIENVIAKALLSDSITKGDKIEISPDDFSVSVIS